MLKKGGKKILIIDDDGDFRNMLSEQLGQNGFVIFHAFNGVEGLQKAREIKPDLILLDIMMPVMDGLTMLHQLRQEPWGRVIPVTILTASKDTAKVSEALTHGVYDFIFKTDWKISEVVGKIIHQVEYVVPVAQA